MECRKLLLYTKIEEEQIFQDMTQLFTCSERGKETENADKDLPRRVVAGLLKMAGSHGFYGNLWQCYLTNLLINDENTYSRSCEMNSEVTGSIHKAALYDFTLLKELFDFDLSRLAKEKGLEILDMILSYEGKKESSVYNKRIRDMIGMLAISLREAKTPEEMKEIITGFYNKYGVGKFGLHKAFRVEHRPEGVTVSPILKIAHIHLDDLIGYEIAKSKLIQNTEAFLNGKKANNCLLYGDAGTGKSSCMKAIVNEYFDRGLRIIEIYKHQFQDLHDVIAQIKDRNYKFILYLDDLSFEDFEIEYKYLKAVIEGGLEKKPDNVLIYATSNRRHLVREKFSDKEERRDDLHSGDTVQEKLSLSSRFGVTIYFGSPDKLEFAAIVKGLAKRHQITMPEDELLLLSNQWELSHGGLSGRTAQQFIDYLLGL